MLTLYLWILIIVNGAFLVFNTTSVDINRDLRKSLEDQLDKTIKLNGLLEKEVKN